LKSTPWKTWASGALGLFVFLVAPVQAASGDEEVRARMLQTVWSALPESQTVETVLLAMPGKPAEKESDLIAQFRVKYIRKAPNMRIEVMPFEEGPAPVFVQNERDLWFLSRVGATPYATLADKKNDPAFWLPTLFLGDPTGLLSGGNIGASTTLIMELVFQDEKKRFWLDQAEHWPIQADVASGPRRGFRFRFLYHKDGFLQKIIVYDAAGRLEALVVRDQPHDLARVSAVDDDLFSTTPAIGRLDFLKRGLSLIGGHREVVPSTGVRGLDEANVNGGPVDYPAIERMEQNAVAPLDVERFLREGHLEKYR